MLVLIRVVKLLRAFLVLALVAMSFAYFDTLESIMGSPQTYLQHAPIIIDGNRFNPSNGVIGGAGTQQDPYVIAGWDITSPISTSAIQISNSNAFFIIRDVTVHSGGIVLSNVTNGIMRTANLLNSGIGLTFRTT